eukprot:scaffold462_cov195-Pinguiococcus_pyrenoidosus.AAC.11
MLASQPTKKPATPLARSTVLKALATLPSARTMSCFFRVSEGLPRRDTGTTAPTAQSKVLKASLTPL